MDNRKSKLDKFSTVEIISKASICGGVNKSDVNYTDSKKSGGSGWDISVQSLIDNVDSKGSLDNPIKIQSQEVSTNIFANS